MDKLTLPRLTALQKNWQENGSTYLNSVKIKLMIEAYLGISEKTKEQKQEESGSIGEFISMFKGMGGKVG